MDWQCEKVAKKFDFLYCLYFSIVLESRFVGREAGGKEVGRRMKELDHGRERC